MEIVEMDKKMDKKWIQKTDMKKGALRKELNVPEGKKISAKKLDKAMHSSDPKIKKQAVLAKTLKSMKK